MRRGPILVAVLAGIGLLASRDGLAQADSIAKRDTIPFPRYRLEQLTVVAHRRPTLSRETAVATSVITREMIERLPVRTLADVLDHVPGLVFLERDGAGQLPMAVARGFFGGGETEYVQLIVDGVPVNDLTTGAVQWTQVPLASVERIEVLRGGASTMYGDAAIGAVVSVETRGGADGSRFTGSAGGGAWGDRFLAAGGAGHIGSGRVSANAAWSSLDGFREHASSEDISFDGAYRSGDRAPFGFRARVFARHLTRDEPGPLTAGEAARDPRQRNPLYDSDHRQLRSVDLSVGVAREATAERGLSWDTTLRLFRDENTRTLLLTPDVGDTQFRDERAWSLWSRFQYDLDFARTFVVTGVEAEYGEFETAYYAPDDLTTSLTSGAGGRLKAGLYAEARQEMGDRWNAFAGARLDVLRVRREEGDAADALYGELSPRVGATFAYSLTAGCPGRVYATVTRSFKAPTLDQLYDVRELPAGEQSFTISNPQLRPQTSTGFETGFNQRFPLWPGAFGELGASLYRLILKDEIDFDIRTFRYGNIHESRHDGLEVSLRATLSPWATLEHSSNFMRVVFRSGQLEGNRLKNIPRSAIATSLHLSSRSGISLGLAHRYAASMYLDDGNAYEIPGYHSFSGRLDWSLGPAMIFLSVDNVFDVRTNSLGFLSFDPATGEQVPFVYPLGGRAVRAGVAFSR